MSKSHLQRLLEHYENWSGANGDPEFEEELDLYARSQRTRALDLVILEGKKDEGVATLGRAERAEEMLKNVQATYGGGRERSGS